MERILIASKSWVVVCDGAKALFLQNAGDSQALNLKVMETLTQTDEPSREQGADRPGRVYQSVGEARSSMEDTDWHEQAEASFLKDVAEKLGRMARSGVIENAVLVAPPKALGILRAQLSDEAASVVRAELAKDYVKMPVPDIEKHLTA
ncbi:host attachment protein [Rhizobium daejeonense]|uniref:Host attachment protein n=1 Tax=Rhizobium daejeonense TaxID=240521 RepID=A0A6M1S980_9HYPH|nr:host attachment family protein [Rhizobium daejeonense]NGO63276.1 host attachment protein [Rhizobium daejeonense]